MAKPEFHWSLNEKWKEKAIAKIKKARAKQPSPNKGRKWSDDFKAKVRDGVERAYKEGRLKPYAHWTGKKMPESVREKMSESAKKSENSGRFKKGSKVNLGRVRLDMRGSNNPNWRGGTTTEADKRIHTFEWKQLRLKIYQRDRWRCQLCGKHCWKDIQCHHIIAVREGGNDKPENLITLCSRHHLKIEGSKLYTFWEYYLGRHVRVSLN